MFCASAFSNKSLIEETTKRLLRTSLGPKLAGDWVSLFIWDSLLISATLESSKFQFNI